MSSNKKTFTLAEILIIIAIIGVVAAITIPVLLNNYHKRVWAKQLIKFYATSQQGFKIMLADEGTDTLSETSVFQNGIQCRSPYYSPDKNKCEKFYTNLNKYFKISDIIKFDASTNYKTKYLNINGNNYSLSTNTVVQLMDGTIFWLNLYKPETNNGIIAHLTLDVNGTNKPNIYGRDIFYFIITENGYIYPWGSLEESGYNAGNNSYYWRTSPNGGHFCDPKRQCYGTGCTARVLEEGNMNY